MSDVTVSARHDIEVLVNCPNCDYMIDLLIEGDTSNYNHNEDGHILSQACPIGNWTEMHEKFEVEDVQCGRCDKSFNVKGMEW